MKPAPKNAAPVASSVHPSTSPHAPPFCVAASIVHEVPGDPSPKQRKYVLRYSSVSYVAATVAQSLSVGGVTFGGGGLYVLHACPAVLPPYDGVPAEPGDPPHGDRVPKS